MKRVFRVFLVICSLFLLSGCMKYNVSMGINKDKSMDLQVIFALDVESFKEMMGSMDSEGYDDESLSSISDMSEAKEIFRKRGYEVEDYSEGNYNGIIANLKIKNIDDVSVEEDLEVVLSNILNEDFDDSKFFKIEKKSDKNVYTANFVYKDDEQEENEPIIEIPGIDDSEGNESMTEIPGIELKYVVKLPYKVISDNADSKTDNELTWNINGDTNIKYSFEIPNEKEEVLGDNSDKDGKTLFTSLGTFAIIGSVVLLVLIVIIVIIIVVSKNKKKKNNIKSNAVQNITSQEPVDKTESVITNESLIASNVQSSVNGEGSINQNTQVNEINNKIDDVINDEQANNNESEILNIQETNIGPKKCPNCGVEVENNQKFCMNCGSKLD